MNPSRTHAHRQLDLSAVKNREEVTKNAILARLRALGPQSFPQLVRWFRGTPQTWLATVLTDLVRGCWLVYKAGRYDISESEKSEARSS